MSARILQSADHQQKAPGHPVILVDDLHAIAELIIDGVVALVLRERLLVDRRWGVEIQTSEAIYSISMRRTFFLPTL
jgi:hypothetical protein